MAVASLDTLSWGQSFAVASLATLSWGQSFMAELPYQATAFAFPSYLDLDRPCQVMRPFPAKPSSEVKASSFLEPLPLKVAYKWL